MFTGIHLHASNLDEAKKVLEENKVSVEELKKQLEEASVSIEELNGKIQEQEELQNKLETSVSDLEEDMKAQRIQMKHRIQYIYENGSQGILTRILEAQSWAQMVNEISQINQLSNYDRTMCSQYERSIKELEELREKVQVEQIQLEGLRSQQEQVQESLVQNVAVAKEQMSFSKENYDQLVAEAKAREEATRIEDERRQEEEYQAYLKATEKAKEAAEKEAEKGNEGDSNVDVEEADDDESETEETSIANIEATQENIKLLATIIQCESGNQPYEGQLAVGSVVVNRVRDPRFPNTIKEVIYQPYQFSPVSSGRFALYYGSEPWASCIQAAKEVIGGNITIDALFFRVNDGSHDGLIIGDHVFF